VGGGRVEALADLDEPITPIRVRAGIDRERVVTGPGCGPSDLDEPSGPERAGGEGGAA